MLMKIMRPHSRCLDVLHGPAGAAWLGPKWAFWINSEEPLMKWETPRAVEMRFGMEITMYIAHR
jgi:coenzyme PQQ precursor peptide PqqA